MDVTGNLEKRCLQESKNAHDWLGHGIYFWENNPKRALDWAKFMSKHPTFKGRVKEPFAIGAIIDLGNCLDLTEAASLGIVEVPGASRTTAVGASAGT